MGNGPCTGTLSFGYDAILLMDINGYRRNGSTRASDEGASLPIPFGDAQVARLLHRDCHRI